MRQSAILLLVCIVLLVVPFSQARRKRRDASLTLRASPKPVVEGTTASLKIECQTPAHLKDVFLVLMIGLDKTDVNETTTSVAIKLSEGLETTNDSRIVADSKLSKSDPSHLTVTINKPTVEDSGVYTCRFMYLSRGSTVWNVLTLSKQINVTVTASAPANYVPEADVPCDCTEVFTEINKIKESHAKDIESLRTTLLAYEKHVKEHQPIVVGSPAFDDACRVTFSARFAERDGNAIVPNSIVAFNAVTNNKGGAYDVTTGEFTAPCTGQYFFTLTLRSHTDLDSGYVDGVLQVDGQELARTSVHVDAPIENIATSSNGLVVTLEKGQKVSVLSKTTSTGSFIGEAYSIFSGFFLYP